MVLEGTLAQTIDGKELAATPGTIVRMPSGVPHAVRAPEPARMLLLMLRDAAGADR
jgi:quercetin dioxygenase-like cupin family protein